MLITRQYTGAWRPLESSQRRVTGSRPHHQPRCLGVRTSWASCAGALTKNNKSEKKKVANPVASLYLCPHTSTYPSHTQSATTSPAPTASRLAPIANVPPESGSPVSTCICVLYFYYSIFTTAFLLSHSSDWPELFTDQDSVPTGFKGAQVGGTTALYYTLIEP